MCADTFIDSILDFISFTFTTQFIHKSRSLNSMYFMHEWKYIVSRRSRTNAIKYKTMTTMKKNLRKLQSHVVDVIIRAVIKEMHVRFGFNNNWHHRMKLHRLFQPLQWECGSIQCERERKCVVTPATSFYFAHTTRCVLFLQYNSRYLCFFR